MSTPETTGRCFPASGPVTQNRSVLFTCYSHFTLYYFITVTFTTDTVRQITAISLWSLNKTTIRLTHKHLKGQSVALEKKFKLRTIDNINEVIIQTQI